MEKAENKYGDITVEIRNSKLIFNAKNRNDSNYGILKFTDVVDEDLAHVEERISSQLLGRLLESLPFRIVMLFFIVLNCVIIGIQTDQYIERKYGAVLYAIDHICLTVFVIEILLKWYHDFFAFWKSGWNVLDFVIVAAAILGPNLSLMNSGSRVLKSLRVFRALRSLRSISVLEGLQVIVQTIVLSLPDMANIVSLMVIIMFVFSVLGVSFFSESCPNSFGSLGKTMFSLFVCVTQDGWMGINDELEACGYAILGAIYLIVFITIGAFVFANLVVADVVANLELAISEQHKEKQKKLDHDKAASKVEVFDSTPLLLETGYQQDPLEIPDFNMKTQSLETYFTILAAIEDNLVEFHQIKEQLIQIVQDIKALANADELSDDDIFEFSTMATGDRGESVSQSSLPPEETAAVKSTSKPPTRRVSIATDALSGLILRGQKRGVTSMNSNSLHQYMLNLRSTRSWHSLPRSASSFGSTAVSPHPEEKHD